MSESSELIYWYGLLKLEKLIKKENEENFKDELKLFSKFLVNFDRQYHYNETFIPMFADEFLLFIKYFCCKFPFVIILMTVVGDTPGIKMVVDRYWQCKCEDEVKHSVNEIPNLKYSVYENPDFKLVCNNKMRIECSFLVESKRFLFHKEIDINENLKQNEEDIKKLEEEIRVFIKKHKKGEMVYGKPEGTEQ